MFWPILLLATAPFVSQDEVATPEDIGTLVARLVELADQADSADLERLAQIGTREAAEGLVTVLDAVGSVAKRLDVVHALARFDGVAEAEQIALAAIVNAATQTSEIELYSGAVDTLAACPSLGKHFLRMIVNSPASPAVRERAMLRHVELAEESDHEWYEELFGAPRDRKAYKAAAAGERGRSLTSLRELALGALGPTMKDSELVKLAKEHRRETSEPRLDGIRRVALSELARREHNLAKTLAGRVLVDTGETGRNRVEAARILFTLRGERMAPEFIDVGMRDISVVPMQLRLELAALLRQMPVDSTERKLLAQLRKARGADALFCIEALGGSRAKKLAEELVERLEDPSREVRTAAARALGEFEYPEAIEPLRVLIDTDLDAVVVQAGMTSLSKLSAEHAPWWDQLREFTDDRRDQVRNTAIKQLIAAGGPGLDDLISSAFEHQNWSTRLVALEYLEHQRTREATGRIIERMSEESGFVVHRFAETLWRLTGEPHRTDPGRWQRWWRDEGASFEPISPEELALRELGEQRRRLSQATKAKRFFGVKLESRRMVFIIDVSGSMDERLLPAPGEEVGKTRMEVARTELSRFLAGLDDGTLFNVLVFSSDVRPWKHEGAASSNPETRQEAVEFVEQLMAGGATNLYEALETAFRDPDIDTIFLLSDGEPSAGAVIEPYMIRRRVEGWNANRGAVIHCISVGGSLAVLEDLARDTGGTYVEFE